MDWSEFKPLLRDGARQLVQLSLKTQQAAVPPGVEDVMACLNDGTIDAGDFEQVSAGLLRIVLAMPEYQVLDRFTRDRSADYRKLYRALGEATDDDYAAFLALQQQIAAEILTETLLEMLAGAGLLQDRRAN